MNIEIKKLEPSITSDYTDFFDNRAFTDNREWSACYCVFFHWNDEYEKSLRAPGVDVHVHNRNLSAEMIEKGILKGYLAYDGDVAVGWVNANDKNAYEKLNPENRPDLWDGYDKSAKTISITCFAIAPDYRRKGIASALLKRVLEDAAVNGYDFVEAYVRDIDETIRNYHGPEALYKKAGFEVYKNLGIEKIIRKALKE